jgi:mannitol-1-phosphate/altronate dehydrogenase
MTEKNRLYIRDMGEEDKPLSYAKGVLSSYKSSIIKTETNTRARDPIQKNEQDQHATFAPCSLAELEQLLLPNQKIQINTSVHKWTITTDTRSIR